VTPSLRRLILCSIDGWFPVQYRVRDGCSSNAPAFSPSFVFAWSGVCISPYRTRPMQLAWVEAGIPLSPIYAHHSPPFVYTYISRSRHCTCNYRVMIDSHWQFNWATLQDHTFRPRHRTLSIWLALFNWNFLQSEYIRVDDLISLLSDQVDGIF